MLSANKNMYISSFLVFMIFIFLSYSTDWNLNTVLNTSGENVQSCSVAVLRTKAFSPSLLKYEVIYR